MIKEKIQKNKEKFKLLKIYWWAIVLLILGTLDYLRFKIVIDSANSFVLYITFVTILWYSWETKKLREATDFQKHLSIYPLLTVKEENNNFYVINIGKGPAIDYKTEGDYSIAVQKFIYSNLLPSIFDDSNAKVYLTKIKVGEEEIAFLDTYKQNSENCQKKIYKQDERENKNLFKSGEVTFYYQDICGKNYKSKIIFTPVGVKLEKFEILT